MKQIEELMAMTTHANGMSFEKAEFVHLYRNRVFLAQEYVRGRMVFGELVRVLESDSGTAFIEKVLTVIRTSATELEAMKKYVAIILCAPIRQTIYLHFALMNSHPFPCKNARRHYHILR